ncbi:hypothetical protein ABB37_09475 [Leptomonas pyrrhocoris]|uniref:Uncharacterized protein n=1 Tax=Leptomonas pyrrhocoris TaxID=157538 RepID=A0A0N0DR99_LEPPY|nr:hypothetical protein ABB37_09475 [Leptomonas pyrrhocoris]KPA73831.1 hypothetical protein ABB37_09475 [Leptomonas pyrrhocoris]|eukprot:XP_015652270.1 hypothetical protein ABB37_09475 [Leptomonas pyrrhocoris]
MSTAVVYKYMASQPGEDLCTFYQEHQCSGFEYSCNSGYRESALCDVPCNLQAFADTTCYGAMWAPMMFTVAPLLVLSVFFLCACLFSLILTVKMVMIGRRVAQRSI